MSSKIAMTLGSGLKITQGTQIGCRSLETMPAAYPPTAYMHPVPAYLHDLCVTSPKVQQHVRELLCVLRHQPHNRLLLRCQVLHCTPGHHRKAQELASMHDAHQRIL